LVPGSTTIAGAPAFLVSARSEASRLESTLSPESEPDSRALSANTSPPAVWTLDEFFGTAPVGTLLLIFKTLVDASPRLREAISPALRSTAPPLVSRTSSRPSNSEIVVLPSVAATLNCVPFTTPTR
jgi:hypothetical protein